MKFGSSGTIQSDAARFGRRYFLAAGLVVLFAAVRVALEPVLGPRAPYLLFFPAVLLAAWYGGLGPGLVATAGSALVSVYLLLEPTYSFRVQGPGDTLSLAIFLAVGSLVSGVYEALHRSRGRAEENAERLTRALEDLHAERARLMDLSERVRQQNEVLSAQNARLEETDRQRTLFLALLAHELRNPLAPLLSAAGVLEHLESTQPAIRRQRQVIARQARHLSRLVDDLLDAARITSGSIALRPERMDLREALKKRSTPAAATGKTAVSTSP